MTSPDEKLTDWEKCKWSPEAEAIFKHVKERFDNGWGRVQFNEIARFGFEYARSTPDPKTERLVSAVKGALSEPSWPLVKKILGDAIQEWEGK